MPSLDMSGEPMVALCPSSNSAFTTVETSFLLENLPRNVLSRSFSLNRSGMMKENSFLLHGSIPQMPGRCLPVEVTQ